MKFMLMIIITTWKSVSDMQGGDLTRFMQRSKRAAFLGPIVSATADQSSELSIRSRGDCRARHLYPG